MSRRRRRTGPGADSGAHLGVAHLDAGPCSAGVGGAARRWLAASIGRGRPPDGGRAGRGAAIRHLHALRACRACESVGNTGADGRV